MFLGCKVVLMATLFISRDIYGQDTVRTFLGDMMVVKIRGEGGVFIKDQVFTRGKLTSEVFFNNTRDTVIQFECDTLGNVEYKSAFIYNDSLESEKFEGIYESFYRRNLIYIEIYEKNSRIHRSYVTKRVSAGERTKNARFKKCDVYFFNNKMKYGYVEFLDTQYKVIKKKRVIRPPGIW